MSLVLGLLGKVGIVVFVIIVVALVGGALLDRVLDTGRLFMGLLVFASVPVTLISIYRISLATISRLQEEMAVEETEDDATE